MPFILPSEHYLPELFKLVWRAVQGIKRHG
jgi:hypothetical protein